MEERTRIEEELFYAAVDLDDPAERASFLDRACGDDRELRASVEELLASQTQAEGYLSSAVARATLKAAGSSSAEGPGTRIDAYELIEELGEGGFGTVYVAEQTEPVTRRVALKILKPGMDTKQVISRFAAERQALAMMDHPNIARVFDGGATARGRPYFVMELVHGIPITQYCDRGHLPIRERLDLFQQVCRGIQHSHQKGIIHRDIKPSNVLVEEVDGFAVPKVIDFGIAKATEAQLTSRAVSSELQLLGTPEYMSPEQAGGSNGDVDTRCDVYSLGVLLYELLVGRLPFEMKEAQAAGLEAIRKKVREDEPQRPSTRASTQGRDSTASAQCRRSDPRSLARDLQGDLDWITMKALEKDHDRRYPTASAFAADVTRYLRDEPVEACPPSVGYRLRKLIKRNKGWFAAAVVVLAALGLGVIGTTLGLMEALDARDLASQESTKAKQAKTEAIAEAEAADEARAQAIEEAEAAREARAAETQAREQAELELAKFQAVNDFLQQGMLRSIDPDRAKGREVTIREILLDSEAQLDEGGFQETPEVEAEIRYTLGAMYDALGHYDQSERNFRQAIDLLRQVVGDAPDLRISNAMVFLGGLISDRGEVEEAESLIRRALAMARQSLPEEHSLAAQRAQLANVLSDRGRYAAAEMVLREAMEVARRTGGEDFPDVAEILAALGFTFQMQGRYEEAEDYFRQALTLREHELGEEHSTVARLIGEVALALSSQGEHEKGEELHRRAMSIKRRLLGAEHPSLAVELNNLAASLRERGELAEAAERYREALEIARRSYGDVHPQVLAGLSNLAGVLNSQGQHAEARALYQEALAAGRRLPGGEHRNLVPAMHNLGMLYHEEGEPAKAEALLRDALAMGKRLWGEDHPDLPNSLCGLAKILVKRGEFTEAAERHREGLALQRRLHGDDHPDVELSLSHLARIHLEAGEFAEAEPLLVEAIALRKRLRGEHHPSVFGGLNKLANVLLQLGKYAEVEPVCGEMVALAGRLFGPEHPTVVMAKSYLGTAMQQQDRLEEAERLHREALDLARRLGDRAGPGLSISLVQLAGILGEQGKYTEAEPLFREAVETMQERVPPDHPTRANILGIFGRSLLQQERAAEAEPLLRESLAITEKALPPGDLGRARARSLLGAALAGLGRHEEAEPLLLAGYEDMEVPDGLMYVKVRALERIVQLYDSWQAAEPGKGHAEKAATWRAELEANQAADKDEDEDR